VALFPCRFGSFLGALHAYGLARAFPGPGVRGGALSPHRQAPAMTDAAVAIDCLQALKICLQFAAQITLDWQLTCGDRLDDLVQLLATEVFPAQIWVNVGLFEYLFRGARANAVNIR